MAKSKTALLSLGSRGTIGNSLTFQKHRDSTIIRRKPTPKYTLTLLQQYQRWLYEDYVALWHQQTNAVKATYRTAGSRRHMSAFAYWMSYNLTNLPDIAGYWKMDAPSITVLQDSSKNANVGTIFGATPTPFLIDGGLSFDGLDDYAIIPASASLNTMSKRTYEIFIHYLAHVNYNRLFDKDGNRLDVYTNRRLYGYIYTDGVHGESLTSEAIPLNKDSHAAMTYDHDGDRHPHIFINGVECSYDIYTQATGTLDSDAGESMRIATNRPQSIFTNAILDQAVIYNRILSDPDILRHSLRRYP